MTNTDNPDVYEYVRNSAGAFARITDNTTRKRLWRFRTTREPHYTIDVPADRFKRMTDFIKYIKVTIE